MTTPPRNAPCPCGSGEKYKRCCGAPNAQSKLPQAQSAPQLFAQGMQLLRSGQSTAAMPVLLAAINAGATHFEAFHALGLAMLQNNRHAQAASILSHAVTLNPQSANALRDLGAAFDHQNLHNEAIAAYARAIAIDPLLIDVQLRLAQLYATYSRAGEAAACLEAAAAAAPKSPQAPLYRVDAAMLRGDASTAAIHARAAVAQAPGNAVAHGALAGVLYNQGDFTAAAESFEAALAIDPRIGKSWDGLAHCRQYTEADTAIQQRLREVLQRQDLPPRERMVIHFALGKVLEDAGDYTAAMREYDAANAHRATGPAFDRAAFAAQVDRAIAAFTPEFFTRHEALGSADETPLFITGMYRSGTTLVEQILSRHPQIAAGGELTIWGPAELEIAPGQTAFDPAQAAAAIAKYLDGITRIGNGAARVTDKLPTNLFRLGAIHTLLPRARIIHCRRDPIDTCLSIYTTNFATHLPFAARRDDLAFYYRQYTRMMAHWREVLPAEIFLELDYETLIAERGAETRRLIDFTGLAWDESCLQPERNPRAIGTASAWQARQPVYATSVQRSRRFADWAAGLELA